MTRFEQASIWLAGGSAVSLLFSIAVSNILLALALAALLVSGRKFRLPPVKLPLALFFLGTVVSLALSEDPAAGRPQIRKFFAYLMLLVVFTAVKEVPHIRRLVFAWGVVAAASALRAMAQFLEQLRLCGGQYGCYVGERISGFMSHWMTFGGQMMIVLSLVAAFLLFAPRPPRLSKGLWAVAVLLGAAIFANGTRSIWLASAVSLLYLAWFRKRWLVAAVPVAAALVILASPPVLRQRVTSIWSPHGDVDSNRHRAITWRTGLRIIQEHPFFGLGPEHVKLKFRDYVPPGTGPLPEGWYGHLHNIYLHYAAERGIPTLLALLWLLGKILLDFTRALRRAPPGPGDERFVLHGAIAALLAILTGGLFEHNLGDSEVLMLFLAVVACGYQAVERVMTSGGAERA